MTEYEFRYKQNNVDVVVKGSGETLSEILCDFKTFLNHCTFDWDSVEAINLGDNND